MIEPDPALTSIDNVAIKLCNDGSQQDFTWHRERQYSYTIFRYYHIIILYLKPLLEFLPCRIEDTQGLGLPHVTHAF